MSTAPSTALPAPCAILPGGEPLIARVRDEAGQPTVRRIRLALGYLFLPGLAPLWQSLESSAATEIQLLIGNTAGVLTDEQRFAASAAAARANGRLASLARVEPELDMAADARAERDRIVTETAQALRENLLHLPPGATGDSDDYLRSLARAIGANRLRVRIYPDGRLHAKASLFEHENADDAVAIVGSSNLTLPSPENPTEMNVVVRAGDAHAAVGAWYRTLWDASQDFTRALFAEVSGRVSKNVP